MSANRSPRDVKKVLTHKGIKKKGKAFLVNIAVVNLPSILVLAFLTSLKKGAVYIGVDEALTPEDRQVLEYIASQLGVGLGDKYVVRFIIQGVQKKDVLLKQISDGVAVLFPSNKNRESLDIEFVDYLDIRVGARSIKIGGKELEVSQFIKDLLENYEFAFEVFQQSQFQKHIFTYLELLNKNKNKTFQHDSIVIQLNVASPGKQHFLRALVMGGLISLIGGGEVVIKNGAGSDLVISPAGRIKVLNQEVGVTDIAEDKPLERLETSKPLTSPKLPGDIEGEGVKRKIEEMKLKLSNGDEQGNEIVVTSEEIVALEEKLKKAEGIGGELNEAFDTKADSIDERNEGIGGGERGTPEKQEPEGKSGDEPQGESQPYNPEQALEIDVQKWAETITELLES